MGSEPFDHVELLTELDELRLQLTGASTRCAALLDDKPLIAALFRLCAPDATAVEVAIVLRMISRLRFALVVVEHALLDRSLSCRGLQRLVAAALGIGVSGVSNRRSRLAEMIEQGKTANPNPRRPKPEESSIRPRAHAIVARHEEGLEQDEAGRGHGAAPDPDDYWGLLLHVWIAGLTLPRDAAAADSVDGLHVLVFLGHQLNRLEAAWLDLGRYLRMPNSILGAPAARRSRNAVWKARRRLRNGTAPAGTFSLTGPITSPQHADDIRPATRSGLDGQVRAMAAALLGREALPLDTEATRPQRQHADHDTDRDAQLRDVVAQLRAHDPELDSWLSDLATAFPEQSTPDVTEPLPESSVALVLFLLWDLWHSDLREHTVLGPVLDRGMDLRKRIHGRHPEHAATDARS